MSPKTSTKAACMFGLLGGTVKVALVMSSNLLLDVVHMPPSAVVMLNGTGDSGYSIAFL